MALGRLYQLAGMEKPAISSYREVVRECPLAVEALRALIQLGLKPRELQADWSFLIGRAPARLSLGESF